MSIFIVFIKSALEKSILTSLSILESKNIQGEVKPTIKCIYAQRKPETSGPAATERL